MWVGDGNVDKRQVHIDMEELALLNDVAGCVMLHVVRDEGLGDGARGRAQRGEAKRAEKK
jgi:hypothetical protein